MKETSSDPPDIESQRSGPVSKAYGFFRRSSTRSDGNTLPLTEPTPRVTASDPVSGPGSGINAQHSNAGSSDGTVNDEKASNAKADNGLLNPLSGQYAPTASAQEARQGSVVEAKEGSSDNKQTTDSNSNSDNGTNDGTKKKRTFTEEFRRCSWMIITHSWINVLLIFVPIGIAVSQIDGIHGGIVFAMNCIAVIPLAGLLSHATESVAHKMGDALGALLNVTFGNAVELIIFIIALTKDQIRIVQASLLGSILANLLLILGMAFFLGGLRFREQIYNSTVTQMSACLLSLSVISLVLPTAFHASFADAVKADAESLKISRGTSVVCTTTTPDEPVTNMYRFCSSSTSSTCSSSSSLTLTCTSPRRSTSSMLSPPPDLLLLGSIPRAPMTARRPARTPMTRVTPGTPCA